MSKLTYGVRLPKGGDTQIIVDTLSRMCKGDNSLFAGCYDIKCHKCLFGMTDELVAEKATIYNMLQQLSEGD